MNKQCVFLYTFQDGQCNLANNITEYAVHTFKGVVGASLFTLFFYTVSFETPHSRPHKFMKPALWGYDAGCVSSQRRLHRASKLVELSWIENCVRELANLNIQVY